MERRVFTYVALAMLVWAILGTATAGYYFTQFTTYQNEYRNLVKELNTLSQAMGNLSDVMETVSLKANILVDYGNETKIWHNNTALPVGSTGFTAILAVGDTRYVDYGGDMGILITSVDGLANNSTFGWFCWYRDSAESEWTFLEYSCVKYILHRGDIIAFTYQSYAIWPPTFPD